MHSMLADLDDGTLLITVNNRLARELHKRYDQMQAAQGRQVWPTPDITPLSAWLNRSYEYLVDNGFCSRVLLNSHQERLLWEQIVRRSSTGRTLLRPAAAARTTQQAWQLMLNWQLQAGQLTSLASDETEIFLMWQQQFTERCQRDQMIASAELPSLLLEAISQDQMPTPVKIILNGFDSHSPLQEKLWAALEEKGCAISTQEDAETDTCATRLVLDSEDDEIRAAAHWARQQLAQNPEHQLAIVSPQLEDQRDRLERIFSEVLNPFNLIPGQKETPRFNLSLGKPLSEFPLISHLLLALRLGTRKPMPLNNIGQLLRSPFIGGHSKEWDKRAQLDWILRDDGLPLIDLPRFIFRAQASDEHSNSYCPDLLEHLQTFKQLINQFPDKASPNQWAGHLLQLFDSLGWPGDQSLNSDEYQQAERLRRAVSEFSTLSRVQHNMSLNDVLKHFSQLCDATVFQSESHSSQVQILGSLEAAGMQFDALWLLGMDDQTWPAAPNPNPLLPTQLQRELAMPHASAERELIFAQQLTERLRQSAPQIIVSHARMAGDREQRPSPLIRDIPQTDIETLGIHQEEPLRLAAKQSGNTEELPAPGTIAPQQSPRGGSHLLASQAACPFKAIATYRLKAENLPEASTTPDARLQGMIVHDLLQRIWHTLKDSATLQLQTDEALGELINPLVDESLADFGRRRPDIYIPAFVALEKQRLRELLIDWLNLEKRRALPFHVLQMEQKQQVEINGLSLQLQADRIDQLDDGGLVIIDYKTGESAKPKGWTDDRPSELQVPLYCIEQDAAAAALIGRVNHKNMAILGEAAITGIAPKIEPFEEQDDIPDWAALVEFWRERIALLAKEVMQGIADIAPLDTSACQYCGMQPLCRINQLQSSEDSSDD